MGELGSTMGQALDQGRPAWAFILSLVATAQTSQKRQFCVEKRTLQLDRPELCDLSK